MPSRNPKTSDQVPAAGCSVSVAAGIPGMEDAAVRFEHASADESRLAESVALMRSFSLIVDDSDRQQVIALAHRLASRD